MTTYTWTDSSALYQVKHGEPGNDRTESAYRYLASDAIDGSTLRVSRMQSTAHNLLDAIRELRLTAYRMETLIGWIADNALVHEDFDQGNHVFNHVVRDARVLAGQLGISYSPGEDPDEDPGAFA